MKPIFTALACAALSIIFICCEWELENTTITIRNNTSLSLIITTRDGDFEVLPESTVLIKTYLPLYESDYIIITAKNQPDIRGITRQISNNDRYRTSISEAWLIELSFNYLTVNYYY